MSGPEASAPGRHPLVGHGELRRRLEETVHRGRLPQSLLLHGPPGVGKQSLGLWLGTLLLCQEGTACGRCRSCRLAGRLEHPDLHWFFPLPRPGGSDGAKLREKLEEARMEELERRRRNPLGAPEREGPAGIYLAAVEEMRSRASRRPAMGGRQLFLVGDADAMVPQAASPQAANAFLKLLEEPPADCYLVLTSSRPGALLPTVRSRTTALRVPPLGEEEVASFLEERMELSSGRARAVARRSEGSIGRALEACREEGGERREAAEALVRAALSRRPLDRWLRATTASPSGARAGYADTLDETVVVLRDLLALSLGRPGDAFDPEGARALLPSSSPRLVPGLLRAVELVEEARSEAAGNVNPQALTATLLAGMAGAFGAGG